jgi:hypothetical protein
MQANARASHAPSRRDTVGLVLELLWPQLVKVLEGRCLDDLSVQRSDSVDRVRPNNGQVGHVHSLVGTESVGMRGEVR